MGLSISNTKPPYAVPCTLTVKFSNRYVLHKIQEFKKDVLELEISLENSLQNDKDRFHIAKIAGQTTLCIDDQTILF